MSKYSSKFYRRELPQIDLSVERGTDRVPNDGKFHILRDGEVLESFKLEKTAVARFREIAQEIGFSPEGSKAKPTNAFEEDLDHYFDAKELYWGESHKYADKGGPGR